METAGLGEGVQLVNVMINGTSQIFALTGHFASYSIDMMIRMFKAIHASRVLHEQKKKELKPGEVLPDQLISYASDKNTKAHSTITTTAIMQLDDVIVEDFEKYAQHNNISYAKLQDLNSGDGKTEIMYLSDHSQIIGAFIQENSPHARAYTMEDYLGNATAEDINRIESLVSNDSRVKEGVKALEMAGRKGPVYTLDDFASFCNNYYVASVADQDKDTFLSFAAQNDIRCAELEKNQYEGSYIAINLPDVNKMSDCPVAYNYIDAETFYQSTKDYYKSNDIYNERQLSFMRGIARHGYARENEEYLGDNISITIDDDVRRDIRNESATSIALLIGEDKSGNKMFAKIPRGDIIASKGEDDKILLRGNINYSIFAVGTNPETKQRFRNDNAGYYNGREISQIRANYAEALKKGNKKEGIRMVMTGKDGNKISSGVYEKKNGVQELIRDSEKVLNFSKGVTR